MFRVSIWVTVDVGTWVGVLAATFVVGQPFLCFWDRLRFFWLRDQSLLTRFLAMSCPFVLVRVTFFDTQEFHVVGITVLLIKNFGFCSLKVPTCRDQFRWLQFAASIRDRSLLLLVFSFTTWSNRVH